MNRRINALITLLILGISTFAFPSMETVDAGTNCTVHPLDCTNPGNTSYGCTNPVTLLVKTSSSGNDSITYQLRYASLCPSTWSRVQSVVCNEPPGYCWENDGGAYPYAYRYLGYSTAVTSTNGSTVYNIGTSAYSRQVYDPSTLLTYACARLTNINGTILASGCTAPGH